MIENNTLTMGNNTETTNESIKMHAKAVSLSHSMISDGKRGNEEGLEEGLELARATPWKYRFGLELHLEASYGLGLEIGLG